MKFNELCLNEKIIAALSHINFENMTAIQEKTIPLILDGCDIVARSQTGSGKTLAYGLPIINKIDTENFTKETESLIICPTRELASQVSAELRKATFYLESIKIVPIFGGADINRQIKALKKGAKIVVGTPGRIIDHLERKTLKLHNLKTVILDEADEMLDMGFKKDIEAILKATPKIRQTLMFSATFPPAIKAITKTYQTNPIMIEIGELNRSLDKINQKYVRVDRKNKQQTLESLISEHKDATSIVFTNTKMMAESVKEKLCEIGYKAIALHGDMRQSERNKVLALIKSKTNNILVATDVAARGIDINDVEYIYNYDIPRSVESFLHRMGRTARAGKSGSAITFVSSRDEVKLLRDFESETKSNIQDISPENSETFSKNAKVKKTFNNATSKQNKKHDNKKELGNKENKLNKFNQAKKDYNTKIDRPKEYEEKNNSPKNFGERKRNPKQFGNYAQRQNVAFSQESLKRKFDFESLKEEVYTTPQKNSHDTKFNKKNNKPKEKGYRGNNNKYNSFNSGENFIKRQNDNEGIADDVAPYKKAFKSNKNFKNPTINKIHENKTYKGFNDNKKNMGTNKPFNKFRKQKSGKK